MTRFSASPKAGRDLSGRLLEFHRWISKLFSRARRSGAPRRRVSSQWAVIKLVRMDVEVVLLMHRVPRTTAKATCRCLHGHGKACCSQASLDASDLSCRVNLLLPLSDRFECRQSLRSTTISALSSSVIFRLSSSAISIGSTSLEYQRESLARSTLMSYAPWPQCKLMKYEQELLLSQGSARKTFTV